MAQPVDAEVVGATLLHPHLPHWIRVLAPQCGTSAIVQSGIARHKDLQWYKKQGAVGVLCGRFIDEQGKSIIGELDERLVGINLAGLRKCKEGLLVVSGHEKKRAILAALRGGYVTHLVIDEPAATSLLDA